ncbi:WD domain, G-beta repeat [compost metagenome]
MLAYSFTSDHAIELRSVPDGRLLQRLSGHTEPATALAFSPDGQLLASACHGKRLIIWDLDSGAAVKRLDGLSVDSLRFAPDGQRLFGVMAKGERDKCLQVWDRNGKPLSEVFLQAKRLKKESSTGWLDFGPSFPKMNELSTISPSCSLVSVGDQGESLYWGYAGGARPSATDAYLFDASGRQFHHQILTDCRMIHDLVISPNDEVLAGTSFDGLCDLVDTQTGLNIRAFKGDEPFHRGECMALSQSGELLVLADQYRQVYAFASDLPPLLRRPLADLTEQNVAWLGESAARDDLTGGERHWLAFVQAQLRWKRRFDVGLAQSQQWIPAGDFDIEL